MKAAVKSEFIKLFSTRATYGILLFAFGLMVLFAFYISGYRGNPLAGQDPNLFASMAYSAVQTVGLFAALIAMLLVVNEYRHNTIMYTLTTTNRRTKVFLAKVIVASLFAVVFSLIFTMLAPLLVSFGLTLQGATVVSQTIPFAELLWRTMFFSWAYTMLAVIIAFLVRNQVAAILFLLLIPTTVESLLGLLLKDNVIYLPFTALFNVVVTGAQLDPARAAGITLLYVVGGGIVSWILFIRRDAN